MILDRNITRYQMIHCFKKLDSGVICTQVPCHQDSYKKTGSQYHAYSRKNKFKQFFHGLLRNLFLNFMLKRGYSAIGPLTLVFDIELDRLFMALRPESYLN